MTEESKVKTADVLALLDMIAHGVVTVRLAKDVLVAMAAEGKSPEMVIYEFSMKDRPLTNDQFVALSRILTDSICDKIVIRYTAGKANPLANR